MTSLQQLADIAGARIVNPPSSDAPVTFVGLDSQNVEPGGLFAALPGVLTPLPPVTRASAARRSPELVMDAADIMGHTAEVSLQHYSEASGLHAALRHGERLAERRARHAGRAERAFAAERSRGEESCQ